MELDDINGGLASQDVAEKKRLQEIEKAEDVDIAKYGGETINYAAEKRLVRKLDFWIVPLMMVTYTLQSYDKGIMSAATQFGFNTDLGCYNYAGIMVDRFFLGFLESAVAPAFTVLVTFWWTREEQALRTGLWYSCVGVATTISPLINYGLGQIHSSLASWKPLFLVLGSVTVVWSFVLCFCLPDSPLTTKGLTEEERAIAIRRLERNNAGTISHTFNKAQFFEAFRDFKLYSCTLIILLTGVPSGAIGTFGTIVINGFGFSHFDSLALTCPIGAITALSILVGGYITRKLTNVRYFVIIIYALISVAGTIICWVGPRSDRGLLFAGIFLMAVQVAAGGLAVPPPECLRFPTLCLT